jgi:hypothetical protein
MPTTPDFGSFDPNSYHFSDSDLQQIITKTQDAISEMTNLNSMVVNHTDGINQANRSTSGTILVNNLGQWTTDFNTCVQNLGDLNQRAQALLRVNRNAAETSAAQAK